MKAKSTKKPRKTWRETGKMNPYYKKKWIKALRSGKFNQATGKLVKDCTSSVGHCCLGVLHEIAPGYFKRTERGYAPKKGSLKDVDELFGLNSYSRELFGISSLHSNTLIDMNDSRKKSFKEIADYIEKTL